MIRFVRNPAVIVLLTCGCRDSVSPTPAPFQGRYVIVHIGGRPAETVEFKPQTGPLTYRLLADTIEVVGSGQVHWRSHWRYGSTNPLVTPPPDEVDELCGPYTGLGNRVAVRFYGTCDGNEQGVFYSDTLLLTQRGLTHHGGAIFSRAPSDRNVIWEYERR